VRGKTAHGSDAWGPPLVKLQATDHLSDRPAGAGQLALRTDVVAVLEQYLK
jgi:hypothetical protein